MYPKSEWSATRYKLPHSLFNCVSFVNLVLCFCDLNLPDSMHLCSLKKLELELLNISGDQITHLTSCCPLLEDLYFHGCNRFDDLNINIENQNFKYLRIYEYGGVKNDSKIMISAPYLINLYFYNCLPRAKYEIKKLPSLVTAEFDLYVDEDRPKELREGDGYELARMLSDLHCIRQLNFSVYLIQILSVVEVQKLGSFPISAARIQLYTSLSKFELPGIFYLLKNSTNLEVLSISSATAKDVMLDKKIEDKFDFDEIQYLESKVAEAASMLQNLKTINFTFLSAALDFHKIEFMKFLLKNSKALEKMTVDIGKNNYKELCMLMKKLTVVPRASTTCHYKIMDGERDDAMGSKQRRTTNDHPRETLENNGDRISSLPESLILHILSFLKMPDVTRTCLLSTRWRYVWPHTPCLNFKICNLSGISDKGKFIDRSLFHHEGSKVEKLLIYVVYRDTFAHQIDSWIRFAIRHNVEEFTLDLFDDMYPNSDRWLATRYKLPHSLFKCGSFEKLVLSFCDLNLPDSMHLCSLKKLELELLNISGDQITYLTSCCPLLEDLSITGCNRFDDLNIIAANQNLKYLRIIEYRGVKVNSKMMISAPNLCNLYISGCFPRAKYEIKNLPSLVTAVFSDLDVDGNQPRELREGDGYEWARMLNDLHCVRKLDFHVYFIQVLSVWEVQKLGSFPINVACIYLDTSLSKFELPGIFYLLKNSTNLEELSIYSVTAEDVMLDKKIEDKFDFDEIQYLESKVAEAASLLQKLKTVNFTFLSDELDYLEIEFIKFLLKNSKALEKMTVDTGNDLPDEELCILMEELADVTKASTTCELHII